jgi:2-amino-4-hydroxy-6-hydroxymethyldihydropteridine diphosphokinase
MMPRVAIALGSNVGDRQAHLEYAISRLGSMLEDMQTSAFVETAPVDVPGPQPAFLNAAVVGGTPLSARALFDRMRAIEAERGRARPFPGAPRTLDLDLILFGDQIIDEPDLAVPHPRFRARSFVLEPLSEIAADMVDPVTGKTIGELRELVVD